ncbi:MAG: cellulase family glycosylhydrolase [bacterium]
MKKIFLLFLPLLSLFLMQCSSSQFSSYITREKDKLYEDGKEFRFISFNIPNLHYIEDYLPFEGINPWQLPDEFEIKDALTAIKQLGGKVARTYVLPLRKESDPMEYVRYIEGPGQFDEEAFRTFDMVLKIANEVGVRVIIPLVDNWKWWGGPMDYAAFRGKSHSEFWTDSLLISDFKKTINYLLNRENFYTGVQYKNDKAILAWETGNELDAPYSWTKEIAAFIKSIDKNHLLIDGVTFHGFTDERVNDPNTDILTTHYSKPGDVISNQNLFKGKKAYVIGEYGLRDTKSIADLSDVIINEGLTGGLLWSLRNRNREGGFYHHYERQSYESYRYPGFPSGDDYDERTIFQLVMEKAALISDEQIIPIPIPETPTLLDIKDISEISWQGSTSAQSYVIERKEEYVGNWVAIADNADESKYACRPIFSDETAQVGKRYFYRIKAKNESGESDYSNIVGPVEVKYQKLVDEFENLEKIISREGKLRLITYDNLRKAREDRSRLAGSSGSYIVYKTDDSISEVELFAFIIDEDSNVDIYVSSDGETYKEIEIDNEVYDFEEKDYGYYPAVKFFGSIKETGVRFLKVILSGDIQLSRMEIKHSEVK